MGKSIRIDSNRFTQPNSIEKFRFSTTATTLRASLQDRVVAHIRPLLQGQLAVRQPVMASVT